MVGLYGPKAGELGDGRGPVAQGGRIDVVEARAGVPERLPLGMRPVVGEKARVGNEGAFDGGPLVGVLGSEIGADQHRREEKYQEEIQQDLLRARELGKACQISLPAANQALLCELVAGLEVRGAMVIRSLWHGGIGASSLARRGSLAGKGSGKWGDGLGSLGSLGSPPEWVLL